jgi:hypothetical protein
VRWNEGNDNEDYPKNISDAIALPTLTLTLILKVLIALWGLSYVSGQIKGLERRTGSKKKSRLRLMLR